MIKIRLINLKDIDQGFPEILENLLPVEIDKAKAKEMLQNIINESKHKIFVAEDDLIDNKNSANIIVGATTLLAEQKFIGKGMKVGYIEDVSVKKGYERHGIGRKLVSFVTNYAVQKKFCTKIILYCSKKNIPFYEKLDYKISNDTAVMQYETLQDKD